MQAYSHQNKKCTQRVRFLFCGRVADLWYNKYKGVFYAKDLSELQYAD